MGGSASLLQITSDVMNEAEGIKNMDVRKNTLDQLKLSSEALSNVRRRSRSEALRTPIASIRKAQKGTPPYEVPIHVKALLEKIGIKLRPSTTPQRASNSTKKLVAHIFECLDGLQHLVQADHDLFGDSDAADRSSETESVIDSNREAVGRLLHEMISIYTLCGNTVKVLLHATPEAARVEDTFGRLPLHVAVDRDQPWMDAIEHLIEAYPQALNSRDSGGRLPLHIAVDRQEPNINVVQTLLDRNPHAAMARRGVGRLPLHYAIFAVKPNLEVISALLAAAPESASTADVYGRLALHYAVDKATPDKAVVQCLLRAYPAGASVRDIHLKLPLTIALERDPIDLEVVRLLIDAYPASLVERGGAASKLPLQSLVDMHPTSVCAIHLVASLGRAAITATTEANKRDSPLDLAIARNLHDVTRRLLLLRPEHDPQRLRSLNWRARKIAFVLAKKQIFRPSVLQRLAQLAAGMSGKSAENTVTRARSGSDAGSPVPRTSLAVGTGGHPSGPRRAHSVVVPLSTSPNGQLLEPTIDFTALPYGESGAEWDDDRLSPVDMHDIYQPQPVFPSPRQRVSGQGGSPRGGGAGSPQGNVNFYLRLYKTNSDAFRLAVMFL